MSQDRRGRGPNGGGLVLRPPFPYYGSKQRLAPWIASMLPAHRCYVEPFCGSAAVLFAKSPSPHEVINDVDSNVATFFRMLRERREDLIEALMLTPYSRDEYLAAAIEPGLELDELERARRFFVRASQSFNGSGSGRAHGVSWSAGCVTSGPRARTVRDMVDRLGAVATRLRTVMVDSRNALHVLEITDSAETVAYVDPPYLGTTRSSLDAEGRRKSDYRFDFTSEEDHRGLAEALHVFAGTVVLSGYHSPLYDELYGDWECTEVEVSRPSANRRQVSKRATEVLWSNRPILGQMTIERMELEDAAA